MEEIGERKVPDDSVIFSEAGRRLFLPHPGGLLT
jgi:hypothetical protein